MRTAIALGVTHDNHLFKAPRLHRGNPSSGGFRSAIGWEDMVNQSSYQKRIDDVKVRAHGHWPGFLLHMGLDPKMITKRINMPCPFCGGRDRFAFTDKYGDGSYICRQCRPGNGFQLAQRVLSMTFHEVLQAAEQYFGSRPSKPCITANDAGSERMRKLVDRIWADCRVLSHGDVVDQYLRSRGLNLDTFPSTLRFHPSLGYYQRDAMGKSKKVAEYPAMVASIQSPEGRMVSLHRTYLPDGRKLAAADVKKVLTSGISGAAVRLFQPTEMLALTEGIEKALAVFLRRQIPTWAALNAGNLEKVCIPESVSKIWIYADNDADHEFAGQASAYALARRLMREANGSTRQVQVFVPKRPGDDWSDVWSRRWQAQALEAA